MTDSSDAQLRTVLERGMTAHRAGDIESAAQAYEEVLRHAPGHPDALHRIAEILVRRNQPQHALEALERALESQPTHFPARYARGSLQLAANRPEPAERDFRVLVEQRPEHAPAWAELSRALYLQHRLEEALAAARESVRHAPGNAALHANLGMILENAGHLAEAADTYRAAVELDTRSMAAWNNLGNVLNKLERLEEAAAAFESALGAGEHPLIRASLASVLHRRGHREAAGEQCRKALAHAQALPQTANTCASVATVYEGMGRLEEARAAAEAGLRGSPRDPHLNWILARISRRQDNPEAALTRLGQVDTSGVSRRWRHSIAFERGRNLDRLGRTAEAWEAFTEGNAGALEHWRTLHAGANEYRRELEQLQQRLSPEWIGQWSELPAPKDGRTAPVFLVGFPRSGTTLLDQVLSAHGEIEVLEEKPLLGAALECLSDMPGDDLVTLAQLDEEQRRTLREAYFSAREPFLSEEPSALVVDKLPLNAARAAFIHRVFPDARFILAVRNPVDVCLSCFMQEFGFNQAMANLFDESDIVSMYQLVMDLFDQSRKLLPLRAHAVRYEDLVDDLETQARGLLGFLGLEWDKRVMDPAAEARRRGAINTPSYHQVTRPIYTDAVDRWKHYRPFVNSWLAQLQPFAEQYGYPDPLASDRKSSEG
ncbi:MAG TPA: sulfotransferase [Wenzhouxiangellaceae bacterium]|nr:sulfotransferase [Wenzhouxiangellaceae bacterium]